MARYLALLTLLVLLAMVLSRVLLMRRRGIRAMKFGQIDKTDFLILPFVLFYFYTLFAATFGWPGGFAPLFFDSMRVAWFGVLFCLSGLALLFWSLVSFGRSFRVGIDPDNPDRLVTTGIFAFSRNPIYVAFAFVLLGEFLAFPNWVTLIYVAAATALFHRQVLREEDYLKGHYGPEYAAYCNRVRRYF